MGRKAQYHTELRRQLAIDGYTLDDLRELLGFVSDHTIIGRMQYKTPWTSFEMVQVMNLLNVPYSRMWELFPPKPDMADKRLAESPSEAQTCPMMKTFLEFTRQFAGKGEQ